MPAMPVTRDEVRLLLVRAGVEQVLDLTQLAVAADERRLEALRLQRAARRRRRPAAPVQSGVRPSLPFSSNEPASS